MQIWITSVPSLATRARREELEITCQIGFQSSRLLVTSLVGRPFDGLSQRRIEDRESRDIVLESLWAGLFSS
jgi:hypothetical protein